MGETGRFPRASQPGGEAARERWPREESNLRTQLRRLPLCPLSYGATAGAEG